MKKTPYLLQTIVAFLCFALTSCATDRQRTITQGTVAGSAGGALSGAALGAMTAILTGNTSTEAITKAAVAGAVVGAVVGGIKGHAWGTRVALEKEKFANSEDYMTASIQQATQVEHDAVQENASLKSDIAQLRGSEKTLKNQQEKAAMCSRIDTRRQDVAAKIGIVGDEIQMQSQIAIKESSSDPKRVAQLREQIKALKGEKQQMEQFNRELKSVRNRISA